MNKPFCILLSLIVWTAGWIAAVPARAAEDIEKGLARAWIMQAPPARYPEITEVIFSESVPQWTPPTRLIAFDVSARHKTPPMLVSHYPFPHGITVRCRIPYPSAVRVAYHEKRAPEDELWSLPELAFGEERTTEHHREGYFMLQWLNMEPNPKGVVMGEAQVCIVPPEAWRGRSRPGESGSEGIEFLIRNLSINPRYWDKKYKGPGQEKSSSNTLTVRAGKQPDPSP